MARPEVKTKLSQQPKAYEPTPTERATIGLHAERKATAAPRTKLVVSTVANCKAEMSIDHKDGSVGAALIEASFGTTDWKVAEALCGHLAQLANVNGAVDNAKFQHAMALAQGVQPKDEVEAMLATQMAAIHLATMEYAGRLHRSTSIEISESYERSLSRLGRTFTTQVEALKKYRSGGVQKVIVQHVHVNEGGQAIVNGEVTQPGVVSNIEDQSHETERLLLPERETVFSNVETLGLSVQGSGRARQGGVPVPRRARRSAIRAA
mgnify:CR=1 FL=1